MQHAKKPWAVALSSAAAVPVAAYIVLIVSNAARCGVGYATFIGVFAAMLAVPGLILAIVIAATALVLWRGERFALRRWLGVCAVLALAAAAIGLVPVVSGMEDSSYCRIQF